MCVHDTETKGPVIIENAEPIFPATAIYYAAYNNSVFYGGDYGAVSRIITDGETASDGSFINIKNASDILDYNKGICRKRTRKSEFATAENELSRIFNYGEELFEHTVLHKALYLRR